jgi:hypothetical protein
MTKGEICLSPAPKKVEEVCGSFVQNLRRKTNKYVGPEKPPIIVTFEASELPWLLKNDYCGLEKLRQLIEEHDLGHKLKAVYVIVNGVVTRVWPR